MKKHLLTDRQIRATNGKDGRLKLQDGGGLFLLVGARAKEWRVRCTIDGVRQELPLGTYPDVSLAQARELAEGTRAQAKAGEEPEALADAIRRRRDKSEYTFKEFYEREYIPYKQLEHVSEGHIRTMSYTMENVFSRLGNIKISKITNAHLQHTLTAIRDDVGCNRQNKLETARKCMIFTKAIFRMAKSRRAISAPLDELLALDYIIPKKRQNKQMDAIANPEDFGNLIREIKNDNERTETIRLALLMTAHLALRNSEVICAEWTEFNFQKRIWTIPKERMKGTFDEKTSHVVPLSFQVLSILKGLKEKGYSEKYVFPQIHNGKIRANSHISDVAMNNALKILGYGGRQHAHGLRHSFKTIGFHYLGFSPSLIETQLHHSLEKGVAKDYMVELQEDAKATTVLFEMRADMMQKWSDYLDKISG